MVSLTDNRSNHFLSSENPSSSMATQNLKQKPAPKSMRTLRSKLFSSFDAGNSTEIADGKFSGVFYPESSGIIEALATASPKPDFLDLSQAFSDFSAYTTSDISGELERLAARPGWELNGKDLGFVDNADLELDLGLGFLKPETSEIIENLDPEMIERAVKTCVTGLRSGSIAVNRCSARKLRLLAKNRPENRELIARTGAIPLLVSLLNCNDPLTQENAVTALLNLSLHENNKTEITAAGAIKPLIYVLKTGTAISKQNSACTLLSLSFIEDNKVSIGVSGAIPLLVALLINGSIRGKKDSLTTLYKLCSIEQNKERAIRAGVVKQLVELMSYQSSGMVDKAAVVLNSMAGVKEGKIAIVKEGGIPVLVEVIEEGSLKGKEFAVATLLQLCSESRSNRTLLVREGGIPPLVALSQLGTSRAKHKALILLRYLREPREGEQRLRTSLQEKLDASSSS